MFNLNEFIATYVIKRPRSMFLQDMDDNLALLDERINGKSICVIGGAGSIGSSFVKTVLPFKPASLVVVDTNENALTELTRDLRSTHGMYMPGEYLSYPMDYSSGVFERMFKSRKGFDIVANFSAHKHVRSEKDIYSIEALIRNNIINAYNLLELLSEYPPEEYFCVSTDKAANPVNIMGVSKRIMEDIIFCFSDKFPVKTARFANVAFSNGSLPAGFLERINKLQPLSAPTNIKRYFVSSEESGQICLLACILGENRSIFFPKLEKAQMIAFDEIASKLLMEYGYEVLKCKTDAEAIEKATDLKKGSKKYPVYYSCTDTSGEKAYEEFVTEEEITDMERFCALGVIIGKRIPDKKRLEYLLNNLTTAFDAGTTKIEIIDILQEYIPEFRHLETGKSLDAKM